MWVGVVQHVLPAVVGPYTWTPDMSEANLYKVQLGTGGQQIYGLAGGAEGKRVTLFGDESPHVVAMVVHATDHIHFQNGVPKYLVAHDMLTLLRTGVRWLEVARADNG